MILLWSTFEAWDTNATNWIHCHTEHGKVLSIHEPKPTTPPPTIIPLLFNWKLELTSKPASLKDNVRFHESIQVSTSKITANRTYY